MPYVIAQPCVDVKDKACVDECPVDCIYEGSRSLYINPNECVDCGACEPVCPTEAIFYEDDLPDEWAWYKDAAVSFSPRSVISAVLPHTARSATIPSRWPRCRLRIRTDPPGIILQAVALCGGRFHRARFLRRVTRHGRPEDVEEGPAWAFTLIHRHTIGLASPRTSKGGTGAGRHRRPVGGLSRRPGAAIRA